MAIVSLSPVFNGFQSFLANGLPNNGGFIYTYLAGSVTPQATYTTNLGTIANANPIQLGVDGRPPQEIWLTVGNAFKFVITDSLLNPVGPPYDNIVPSLSSANNLSDVSNPATALANLGGTSLTAVAGVIQSQTYTAFATAGGTTAYTVTASPALTSYTNARLALTLNATPTASPTMNWNGLGAKNWKYYDNSGTKQFVTSAQAISGQLTDNWYDGTDVILLNPLLGSIARSYLAGLTFSTAGASATMSIAAGLAADSTNAILMNLSAIAKTTSAWAVGSGNGGIDQGAIANATWYHFYSIRRPDTGVTDVIFSLSASAPTLPANYTQYRRIGSGKTNGSAQWLKFSQVRDRFIWDISVVDVDATNPGTAAVTRTLTVPTGIIVDALLIAGRYGGTNINGNVVISSLDVSDQTPQAASTAALTGNVTVSNASTNAWGMSNVQCRTNTSAQVRSRLDVSGAADHLGIITIGWIDNRGQEL